MSGFKIQFQFSIYSNTKHLSILNLSIPINNFNAEFTMLNFYWISQSLLFSTSDTTKLLLIRSITSLYLDLWR